jgi:hypothetical protein
MVQLIVLIMGIALAGYVVMAGMNYVNLDSLKAKEQEARWTSTNLGLAQAWVDINIRNHRDPHNAAELEAKAAQLVTMPNPFTLSQLPSGFSGWCAGGLADRADFDAIKNLAERFPKSYGLSDNCGHVDGFDGTWGASLNGEFPIPVVMTYRLAQP